MDKKDFLNKLQAEAKEQAKLHKTRIFPESLDWFTSFVGKYPWQVIAGFSFITALLIEGVKTL